MPLRPALAAVIPVALALLLGTPPAAAQGTRQSPGVSREQMWPAPTAEDWAKPVQITWQRTWEDAQEVSRVTGKPLLVCINMDGEIASEHYAGIRYRDPEVAALYVPYVCVIASVYRHTPRDHDEQGARVECPRFGGVTCGEHIAIEPEVHGLYMDGKRIAPRHIGVDLEKNETYDIYYAFDTASVFDAVREGSKGYGEPRPYRVGENSLLDKVAAAEATQRQEVERAYALGDAELRASLLEAAAALGAEAPVELLRLAAFDRDAGLAGRARTTLSRTTSPRAVDLIVEVLREPVPEAERDGLIAALDRLGESDARARRLAVVHRGLSGGPSTLDAAAWLGALESGEARTPTAADADVAARLEQQDAALGGEDPEALLDLAEAFLASTYGRPESEKDDVKYQLMDARDAALEAERRGAFGWRPNAVAAIAHWYLGEVEAAHSRAVSAVQAGVPDDASDWNTMAVLALFAGARQESIRQALREGREWPGEWIADVHTACSLLARHPHATPEQLLAHYDFLDSLDARGDAERVLDQALERFPGDWELHDRLRSRTLRSRGVFALESEYERRLAEPDAPAPLLWFAGTASVSTAEMLRRWGRADEAVEAYDRAMDHFEQDAERVPESRFAADFEIALALAGQARIAYESGDDVTAVQRLVTSFERRPEAAATLDGLNISPMDTGRMLMARLQHEEQGDQAARLQAAMDALDESLKGLPAFERQVPGATDADARAPWWRNGRGRGRRN